MNTFYTLKKNHEFRRLYAKGTSCATGCMVVYCRKNRFTYNRIGFTVGTKVGGAVVRNRVRRRLREIYRLRCGQLRQGYDVIIVARVRAAETSYHDLERAFLRLAGKLSLLEEP